MFRYLLILWLVFTLIGKPLQKPDADDRQAGLGGGCCPCCLVAGGRREDKDDECC